MSETFPGRIEIDPPTPVKSWRDARNRLDAADADQRRLEHGFNRPQRNAFESLIPRDRSV